MAELFRRKLQRVELRSQKLTELVDAEAELKAKLLAEQHKQEEELRGIHDEFERIIQGGGRGENLSSA